MLPRIVRVGGGGASVAHLLSDAVANALAEPGTHLTPQMAASCSKMSWTKPTSHRHQRRL